MSALAGSAPSPVALASPMQAVSPDELAELSTLVRVGVAFVLVLAVAAILLWRFEPFVDRSIESSTATPLQSVAYGVAAHLVFAFAGVYLGAKLARFSVSGLNAGGLGLALLLALVLAAGALGFTVLGSTIVALRGERSLRQGAVLGALMAGGTMAIGGVAADPVVTAVVWVALVSFGIGGPVRKWVNASAAADV